MNAESNLVQAYHEWHRLADAETKAIQTRNWDFFADCQLATKDFLPLIERLTLAARAEWASSGCDLAEKEQQLHVFVHQLIETKQQNQTLLQRAKAAALERLLQLGTAGRNLKRLQRSYGGLTAAT